MAASRLPRASRVALTAAGVALVAASATVTLLKPQSAGDRDELPTDCGATPSAYHPGTLVDWPAALAPVAGKEPAGNAALYARVRYDSGRMVLAYNATPGRPAAGTRVVVAEIRCIHRTIHLLTELGAPPAAGAPTAK
jgi:hypothetical protein